MTKAGKKGKTRPPKKVVNLNAEEMAKAVDAIETEAGEIDKIRNILFGSQMASVEERFAKLEERINSQIEALGAKTGDHLKKVEALIQKQDEAFAERLNSEQSDRNQASEVLSRGLSDAKEEISKSIDAQADQQSKDIKAVHKQLEALSHNLSDEIHIQQVEAAKNLKHAVEELDADKLARKHLSQLLLEMAGRLTETAG